MAEKNKNFVLIDAQAVLHRAWHALPELIDPQGRVVNAVYGFTALLLKLIREQSPSHLMVAFDTKAPTFRHQEYKEYKAGREKQPQRFYDQIDLTREILKSFNIPFFSQDGFEADDIIGALIKEQKKQFPSSEFLIVTGDLDLCQLIDSQTSVYFLRQGISQIKIYTEKETKEKFGLPPKQLIDLKALCGDPSDNIKGIEGVGPKTALTLIKKFKNIENLYQYLEKEKKENELKEPLIKKLKENKKQVFQDKKLVTIQQKIPGFKPNKIPALKNIDIEKMIAVLEKFGFHSLINRIEKQGINQAKLF
jgi:DNA polymerase I